MSIRTAALIACIATAAGVLEPFRYQFRALSASLQSRPDAAWWAVPVATLVLLFTAILPVFYLALSRDEGTLRVSQRLRILALGAAIVIGIFSLIEVVQALSHRATSILYDSGAPTAADKISIVVGICSSLACMLPLIAIFRLRLDDQQPAIPISRFLRITSRVAVFGWALWCIFNIVRLGYAPFAYQQVRDYAAQYGRPAPSLWAMMSDALRTLLLAASLLTAPLIVYRNRKAIAEPAEPAAIDVAPAVE